VTLWTDPRQDKGFQAAVRQNRVLTVKQETVGSRKDFGVPGFFQEPHVAYWVFPKPLDDFADKRIIGIDYSLLESPKVKDPVDFKSFQRAAARKHAAPPSGQATSTAGVAPAAATAKLAKLREPAAEAPAKPPPPKVHRFRVVIRCQATVEVNEEVEATSVTAAKRHALEKLDQKPISFAEGKQTRKALKAVRLS
jgi:hypothetical protein